MPRPQSSQFSSVADVSKRLSVAGYLPDAQIATTVFLADRLGKPLLVEGPAGTGKTELGKGLGTAPGSELIRLQCYEGLDEARALYEWNYKKQLLRIQAAQGTDGADWDTVHDDIFGEEFLLARPLLTAIRRTDPTVLLIDETDKADVEVEGLLLEVLSDFQVTIPELGTITASRRPMVVLTSNATRELSEALKRRCLYLALDYPSAEREREIVLSRGPDLAPGLAEQLVRTIRALRARELKKSPSISETLDWAQTLLELGLDTLDESAMRSTLGVILKHASDQDRAAAELRLNGGPPRPQRPAGWPVTSTGSCARCARPGSRSASARRWTPQRSSPSSTCSTASSSGTVSRRCCCSELRSGRRTTCCSPCGGRCATGR